MACPNCIRGCADCEWDFTPACACDHDTLEYGCHCPRSAPRYCFDCHHGFLHEVHCGKVVCPRHLKFHDDTAAACFRSRRLGDDAPLDGQLFKEFVCEGISAAYEL